MKVHHIGYLVKSINQALLEFTELGYKQESEAKFDEIRQIDIVFLVKDGYRVELVAPKKKDSATGDLYKKIGNSPYHICYEVENLEQEVARLEDAGYMVIIEPQCAPAINNNKVVFMFNAVIGMIELVEVN